jgi:hypothetical protein
MDPALAYLQKIHQAVILAAGTGETEPIELAKTTAGYLGLPPHVVTPLLARTFSANLRARHQEDLLADHS